MAHIPKMQIRWIVDRHHVSATGADIEKDIRRRAINPHMSKQFVTACIRYAKTRHIENRALFRSVMRG